MRFIRGLKLENKVMKVLINGAGRGCLNLIKSANRLGFYTIVTGAEGPCIPLANKAYREVHPGHPEEVYEVALKENVDAVVTCCNDMGLASVGYCCDKLNLTGLSYESSKIASNKMLMKEKLISFGVRTARFFVVKNNDELKKIVDEIGFPLVVKATDLQGSRGVFIVKEESSLIKSYEEVMSLTHKDYCIIEEFIQGVEFGAQAFVYHGEVLFVMPHGDEVYLSKTAIPIGHYVPYEVEPSFYDDVVEQATKAIKATGLDNCAVNIDFINRNGKPYIIELTGRGGANGLTDIVGRHYGLDYYEMMLTMALGQNPKDVFSKRLKNPRAALSKILISEKDGIFRGCDVNQFENTEINFFVKNNDEIRKFTNSNDAIGEIIVSAETLEKCNEMVSNVMDKIEI